MEFNSNGNLKSGIIPVKSLQDIEEFLVATFPNSRTRPRLYQSLLSFLKQIPHNAITKIWIDGSFCSVKENPNDIDILLFVKNTPNGLEVLRNTNEQHDIIKLTKKLDVYAVVDKNELLNENEFNHAEYAETYWKGRFGFDRHNNSKGIIEWRKEDTTWL